MARITQIEQLNRGTGESGRIVTVDARRYLDSARAITAVWHFRRASPAQPLRGALNLLGTLKTILFGIFIASPSFAWRVPDPVIIPAETQSSGTLRVETVDVANGGQLIIFFEKLRFDEQNSGQSELPLLAVLRDTMGDDDPANDRLRQVWVFTYAAPSLPQRIAAGVPFFYHRSGLDSGSSTRPPHPILDMARPAHGLWPSIAFSAVQSQVLDPSGSLARLTTHSYGGNLGEYRRTHVAEVLDILSRNPGQLTPALTPAELEILQSRLDLSSKLLGGLAGDESLPSVYSSALEKRTENRGHNWELLRQTAEQSGLYFEPLQLDAAPDSFGVIWIPQKDAEANHPFDGQLLHIANPFPDERIRSWNGYSQVWTFDRDGVHVPGGTDRDVPVKMIPLAVYALDYPGVPLLLIDFRNASHPQHTERCLRAANDITTGILGMTPFGSFSYFAAKTGFLFVHKRHGAATDRLARRNAFIALRHAVATGASLDEALRRNLELRIEKLNLDPVEKSWTQEVRAAWRQYDALIKFAADPNGLAKTIERDRVSEYRAATEGQLKRMAAAVLHPHPGLKPEQLTELSERRRLAWSKRQRTNLPDAGASVQAEAHPSTSVAPILAVRGGQ
jgi:hypothetical protein